jgi:periodic tryptophan protein 2
MFVWDAEEGNIKSFIETRNDIAGGRHQDDRNTAKTSTKNKHLTTVALSPNGEFVIGGGNSKNICLYDLKHKVLLKRFAITQNRSLDGVLHKLNSKNVKEGGLLNHEVDQLDSDLEEDAWTNQADSGLRGAKTAKNLLKRNTKLAVRIKSLKFSPDGTQIAAATTEGLVIYSNQL